MYGSDGPGGDSGGPGAGSGGPGGGSETVFGTDVRNRQCSDQRSEPIKVCQVSEGYRKVEEVGGKNSHQVTSKSDFMEPSYGHKTVLS